MALNNAFASDSTFPAVPLLIEISLYVEEVKTPPAAATAVLAVADDATADVVLVEVFGTGVAIASDSKNETVRKESCMLSAIILNLSRERGGKYI